MRKPLRSAVKKSRSSRVPTRRLALKRTAAAEITPDEVLDLEQISKRFEEAERAWMRMTAPHEGDEGWTQVEEHLLNRAAAPDKDRRWKFFSK